MVRFFYKEKESVNAKVLKVKINIFNLYRKNGKSLPIHSKCAVQVIWVFWCTVFFVCLRMSSFLSCWMSMSSAQKNCKIKWCHSGQSSRRWRTISLRNSRRRLVSSLLLIFVKFVISATSSVVTRLPQVGSVSLSHFSCQKPLSE